MEMEAMLRLCAASDVVEGGPISVEIDGLPPFAVYRIEDEIFVTDRTCTHGDADLTEGFQEGDVIECPFHGGAFSIKTGEVVNLPCAVPLKIYPAQVINGFVCIEAKS
ncbi:non-heme iron oxygenase ferredoxin subunit [Hyphococcus sp.]|uniref:non-heme iron oxygenase ferredoxin subunit n=1 Tax=Hyphococcus sp. TaxID=2038636 RepID=UPI0035C73E74